MEGEGQAAQRRHHGHGGLHGQAGQDEAAGGGREGEGADQEGQRAQEEQEQEEKVGRGGSVAAKNVYRPGEQENEDNKENIKVRCHTSEASPLLMDSLITSPRVKVKLSSLYLPTY